MIVCCIFTKAVTMYPFFFLERFIWIIKFQIKKNFFAKICFGKALFPLLVKAKNQNQNFEKRNLGVKFKFLFKKVTIGLHIIAFFTTKHFVFFKK